MHTRKNGHLRHIIAAFAVGTALAAQATIYYCAPEPAGNDENDGLTPDTPRTFSYSASHLSNDDELRILTGTYYPATGSLGSHIFGYDDPVSFCGWDKDKSAPADPKDVIIDLEAKNGLFRTVRGIGIRNLTVQNAKAGTYPGGAIDLAANGSYDDEPAVISNCVFKTNYAGSHAGGAVAAERPSTIIDCYFEGNTNDTDGGALYLTQRSKAIGCTFVGNRSAGMGGAICLHSASAPDPASHVRNCLFDGNMCGYGSGYGAAICLYSGGSSAIPIENCTFVNHLLKEPVQCNNDSSWTEKNLINCVFAGNAVSQGTANTDHCWEGTVADAKFADAAAGDYRLTRNSPCVDAGLNQAWMVGARDLLNSKKVPRIINEIVDIGCYEYKPKKGMFIIAY